jgi:hypothetical protein
MSQDSVKSFDCIPLIFLIKVKLHKEKRYERSIEILIENF